MNNSIVFQLEQYTIKHPEFVLIVNTEVKGQREQILIYKGFSSSLTGQTAFDPDIPVISPDANIISIDRLASPYQPDSPQYIQTYRNFEEFEELLETE